MSAAGKGSAANDDRRFAPVLRDEDADLATDEDRAEDRPVSGTGVPGTPADHPDTLPPTPEGVHASERGDDTGDVGGTARSGRPRTR